MACFWVEAAKPPFGIPGQVVSSVPSILACGPPKPTARVVGARVCFFGIPASMSLVVLLVMFELGFHAKTRQVVGLYASRTPPPRTLPRGLICRPTNNHILLRAVHLL